MQIKLNKPDLIFPLEISSFYISVKFCCMVEKKIMELSLKSLQNIVGKGGVMVTSVIVYHFTPQKCSIKISFILASDNNTNRFHLVNPLPNDKFLDWTKFKAFAGEKYSVAKIMIAFFDNIENIVGKGEKAGF